MSEPEINQTDNPTTPQTENHSEAVNPAAPEASAAASAAEPPVAVNIPVAEVTTGAEAAAKPIAEMTEEEMEAAAAAEAEAFGALVDSYSQAQEELVGEVKKGKVVRLTATDAIVDIGTTDEGSVALDEFKDLQGNLTVKPGDDIDVMVMSRDEVAGTVRLSYSKVKNRKIWADLEAAHEANATINCKVLEKTKGGLAVEIGRAHV